MQSNAGENRNRLLVGAAEVDITPDRPIPLAGFAARSDVPFEGIDRRLFLQAFCFSVGEEAALLVTADILWWPPERMDELRSMIVSRWPITEDHIILHASHTHGGPETSTAFTPYLGIADPTWVQFLFDQLLVAIDAAWRARQPASIERGRGTSHIGINRRMWRGDEVVTAADPEGVIDRELVVLRISSDAGAPIAVLVHHTCHPTTTGEPRVTPDFPGVMREEVNRISGENTVTGYLQGCAGDINPHVTRDRGKRRLWDADVELIGHQLAGDAARALTGSLEPIDVEHIRATRVTAMLPFRHVPTREELTAELSSPGVTGQWAKLLLDTPERLAPEIPMDLTQLSFGRDLGMLAMDGEVTTPYGLRIKELSGHNTLPVAYSNGMIGYVVTRQQVEEGGYEAESSAREYGLPSPFAPELDDRIQEAIEKLLT